MIMLENLLSHIYILLW